jgi:hypothetical protein
MSIFAQGVFEILLRGDVQAALIGALVGSISATVGTLLLERRRDQIDAETDVRQKREAGHRALLALESQRVLIAAINEARRDSIKHGPAIEAIPAISLRWDAVPRIRIEDLVFLIETATDKNILPQLVGLQHSFDQVAVHLAQCFEDRERFHYISIEGNPTQRQSATIALAASNDAAEETIQKILPRYSVVEAALAKGLKETITDFKPIIMN